MLIVNKAYLCPQNDEVAMNKKTYIKKEQIRTKQDVKNFLQQFIDKRKMWEECLRSGRPLSELKSEGINVAKLSEVLK